MIKNTLQVGLLSIAMTVATPLMAGGDEDKGKELSVTCAACHGADGNSTIATNPILAGQYESYLVQALNDYKAGNRTNAIMGGFAAALSNQDILDLAAYFASQDSVLSVPEN